MQTYTLPVYWELRGEIVVKARSLKEAMEKAAEIPLPKHGDYVSDSLNIDEEIAKEWKPQ